MKRVTVFAGHYGSGKTNIAVNYAVKLRQFYEKVAVADLDIVNPYFRTKDSESVLRANGIRLIASPYAGTNVDTPALPAEAYAIIDDKSSAAVIDLGGDDRGALAMGRYSEALKADCDYDMLFVFNRFRPLTSDADSAFEVMKEIEAASGLSFTAIVNNPNIGDETTEKDIFDSQIEVLRLSERSGLPIRFTAVSETLSNKLGNRLDGIFPIKLYVRQSFAY